MSKIIFSLTGALMLIACGGDPSNAIEQKASSTIEADEKSDIAKPPDPCAILSAQAAQAELGARSVSAAPENAQSGQGPAPWECAYRDGDAMISLVAKSLPIGSERGADAVAVAYGADTGSSYTVSRYGAGVVNLVRQAETESIVISWTGLVWAGEGDGELVVEATVSTDSKSPAEREEIANALAELYVGTARQVAAMGG